jgi:hypothetical protein
MDYVSLTMLKSVFVPRLRSTLLLAAALVAAYALAIPAQVTITPAPQFTQVIAKESFAQPHFVRLATATAFGAAKGVGDTNVNMVLGSPLGIIQYWEEQGKTTSSWVDTGARLDISADDTVDNEGVEIVIGDALTGASGWLTVGAAAPQGGGCFEVNFTVALIAGTDQFLIGWRKIAAFDAAANYANYADWAVVGMNNVDGSIFSLGEVATGGTLSDDSGVNAANADTRTFRVCIAAVTGVPTASYTANGSSTFTNITMTNSGVAKTAGVELVPFISYIHSAGAVDTGIFINWMRLTR